MTDYYEQLGVAVGYEGVYTPTLKTYGYLETDGNQLVDVETGEAVRLTGANWHGFESEGMLPSGLWQRSYQNMMDQMIDAGINSLRIPISAAMLQPGAQTNGLRHDMNPDLVGKSPLEVLDAIIEYAEKIGIRIVIDMHRITAGVGKEETGLWFNDSYSEADLISDWQMLAERYADNPTVVAFDLFNEPSGRGDVTTAHWGEGQGYDTDWHRVATDLGNAIHDVNPDVLIFVEGVHVYEDKWYWVGGNLRGVENKPVELDIDNKVVYSPHDYPYSVQNVPWLENATQQEMLDNFLSHWGYIYEDGTAPIAVGETGGRMLFNSDYQYVNALVDYLGDASDAAPDDGGMSIFWWSWTPNSGDTGGILQDDDWYKIDQTKFQFLEKMLADTLPTTEAAARYLDGNDMTFTFENTRNTHKERIYKYEVIGGTATEGADFIGRDGYVRLGEGETVGTIDVKILADNLVEGDETLFVDLYFLDGNFFQRLEGVIAANDGTVKPGDGEPGGVDPGDDDPVLPGEGTDLPPVKLWSFDATRTYYYAEHQLVVETVETDEGEFRSVAELSRYDGGSLGDWALRLDPEGSGMFSIDIGNSVKTQDRADDAQKIEAGTFTGADQTTARFYFETSLSDQFVGTPLSITWDASLFGKGIGASSETGVKAASADGGLDVDFEVRQEWGDGSFLGRITVTNTTDRDISDWVLKVDAEGFDFTAEDVHAGISWDNNFDEMVRIAAPVWDPVLEAGDSFSFGFNGTFELGRNDLNAEMLLDHMDFLFV